MWTQGNFKGEFPVLFIALVFLYCKRALFLHLLNNDENASICKKIPQSDTSSNTSKHPVTSLELELLLYKSAIFLVDSCHWCTSGFSHTLQWKISVIKIISLLNFSNDILYLQDLLWRKPVEESCYLAQFLKIIWKNKFLEKLTKRILNKSWKKLKK